MSFFLQFFPLLTKQVEKQADVHGLCFTSLVAQMNGCVSLLWDSGGEESVACEGT